MHSIEVFKDLIIDIEVTERRIEGLEEEYTHLQKIMFKQSGPAEIKSVDYSGMPKGSRNDMPLDRIIEELNRIDNMLFIERNILENMLKTKKSIEEKLTGLEGIKHKIAYKKIIEGKTYIEIAGEVGLSHDRVRHIGRTIIKK